MTNTTTYLSEDDTNKIMMCSKLFYGCAKKDLNSKENRPKAVIIGLSYSLANKYPDELNEYGVISKLKASQKNLQEKVSFFFII